MVTGCFEYKPNDVVIYLINLWSYLMNMIIADAIASQQALCIDYDGGERTIEPHCYGTGSSEQELLRAFQTEGHSNSGESFGWKLFRLDRMSEVRATNMRFDSPRPGYNRSEDKAMKRIYCKI